MEHLTDRTATASFGDYAPAANSAIIGVGDDFVDITVPIYGDFNIEGDETFDLMIWNSSGATLAGDAAALRATATIADNDDGIADAPAGTLGPAEQIFGPPAEPGPLPTLGVRDISVIEGNSSFQYAYFLVTLDRPATANVTFDYYTQQGSATNSLGDYGYGASIGTIYAGEQSTYVRVPVNGDITPESDETFELIVTNINNGVFHGGAEALSATGTIIDTDSGAPSGPAGLGDFGQQIHGPASDGGQPVVRINDVTVIEGDSSYSYAHVLITLDQPATAPVTMQYYTQSETATDVLGDFAAGASTITIPAGVESTYLRVAVNGDTNIENDETFSLNFFGIQNGQFENNVAAVKAQVTILDNDSGPLSGDAEIGSPAQAIGGPQFSGGILPVVQVNDVTVIEGDSSYSYARFLITLDRPATAPVKMHYNFVDGTASVANGDVAGSFNQLTIPVGAQSAFLQVPVYGDVLIEGDETFNLVLTQLENGRFLDDAPALVATGTILDIDSGPLSGAAGLGDVGPTVNGPAPVVGNIVAEPIDTAIIEGNSSYAYAKVFVILSKPATSPVQLSWQTIDTGSATANTDFNTTNGTLTIPTGSSSGFIQVAVYGDNLIEGDETFEVEFSALPGTVFANGLATMSAEIRIAGNDGAGTPGNGPEFNVIAGPDNSANYITGTDNADDIDALGGNDTVIGLGGNDTLRGGNGYDRLEGGAGQNRLFGDAGKDTLIGGADDDLLDGGSNDDRLEGGAGNNTLNGGTGDDFLKTLEGDDSIAGNDGDDTVFSGDGADEIDGGDGNDSVGAGDGNDTVLGGIGNDTIFGGNDLVFAGNGSDTINGSQGNDTLWGGNGNDRILGSNGRDLIKGGADNDTIFGGGWADTIEGGSGADSISGGNGADLIDGQGGDDILSGKNQADVFVFSDGDDVITDFNTNLNAEKIDLSGVASITDLNDLLTGGHLSSNGGGDAVISDLAGNTLTLTGVAIGTLGADDFLF